MENREVSTQEVKDALEIEILNSVKEVNDLLPELGHGEAKRLLLANLTYPYQLEDFTNESAEFQQAYAASMRITDALIALGVQTTLEAMLKQGIESGDISEGGAND